MFTWHIGTIMVMLSLLRRATSLYTVACTCRFFEPASIHPQMFVESVSLYTTTGSGEYRIHKSLRLTAVAYLHIQPLLQR